MMPGLMITASHQTFSGQIKHLSSQTKYGQTNSLYIINGNFIEFAKDNKRPDNYQSLSKALGCLRKTIRRTETATKVPIVTFYN